MLFDLACPDVAKRQGLFEATPTHFILHDMHIHLSLERIASMPDYQSYCITVASLCSLISEYDVIHTYCLLDIIGHRSLFAAFLALPWDPGQQTNAGTKYLASIGITAAICVRPLSCSWTSVELKAWSPSLRHVPGQHYMWLMIWGITDDRPITACSVMLQTTEFCSTEVSSWKISGFNIIISIQADYCYACSVPDNTYLQSMADYCYECSPAEIC